MGRAAALAAGAAALLLCLSQAGGAAAGPARSDRGSFAVLDAATGVQVARLAANGAVVAAVADGRGGWFVGGSFTRLGRQRRVALARVRRDGTVDPAWRARIGGASGRAVAVYALARAGRRLFVAGPFGRIGQLRRPGLGAVDAGTGGVLRAWSPGPRAWLDVQALALAGPRLLVAGQFGYPTPGIAALDVRTGAVDRRWNPHLRLIGDAGSFGTLLRHRSRVYVAGSFHVLGLRRNGLVALDASTGSPDRRFAPRAGNCPACNGFALLYGLAASDRRLYVSGSLTRIGGVARNGVAALGLRTGAVDRRWKPGRAGRDVLRLTLTGSRLYLGGASGFWALDARTGAVVRLPRLRVPREVLSLAVSSGRLLVAGRG